MKLWSRLYATIWVAFFSCLPLPRLPVPWAGVALHAALGAALLAMALGNARRLATLRVPPRLQRVSRATAGFAVFQLACGLALGAAVHHLPDLPLVASALRVAHLVAGLTILAQASSVATAYDMWEDREYEAFPPPGTAA
jgi:hypothetical protein